MAADQGAAICHCGRVAEPRGSDDPWEVRMDGYCYDCATNRCDCYPDECPVKYPPPPLTPLADHGEALGLFGTLWLVIRGGVRLYG